MRDFALEVHFSRWEFAARHNLAASDAQSLTVAELLALGGPGAHAALLDTGLGYTPTWGDPALRADIAATYPGLGPQHILTFAGAEEGIYAAMRVLLTPDDHAIVLTPNYQSAETLPLAICAVSGVALDPDGWTLDLDALRAAIRPNTKLISINFPHNPTGRILPAAQFADLVALCRQHGLWLFSDEVYRLIERAPATRLAPAACAYERGLSLGVLSKSYGLPGLRIGWIACQDLGVLQRMERYKHYLSICNAGPSETLARIALGAAEPLLARTRATVAANLALLEAFFAEHPGLFEWRVPDGGCTAYVRYRGADGVEAFTERLVAEAGVLLLPASLYASSLTPTPPDRFRIGYGRTTLAPGLAALRAWLHRNTA